VINAKEYIVAAIAAIAYNQQRIMDGAFTADQLQDVLISFYGIDVPITLIEPCMDYAVSLDLASRFDDPFTPPHFMITHGALLDAVQKSNNSDSAFTKVKMLGQGWMGLALDGLVNKQSLEDIASIETGIPASDRIVSIGDNQRAKFVEQLNEVTKAIVQSNSVRDELGDDADRIVAEINAGKQLLSVAKARISALVAVLLKPLRYLAERFTDGAIGALATALVVELLKLI
jgi:hypothetical protein